jgi:hypothetical protein
LIDALISLACITVLFVAEQQRCCEPDNPLNIVAETEKFGRASYYDSDPVPCSCPSFGTRLYGGLGTIEPYTSLVILRVLRHWMARKLFYVLRRKYNWPKLEANDDSDHHPNHSADTMSSSQVMKFGARSLDQMNSVVVVTEVWEATIGAYPHVAAAHGEFSSEILQAMLGVSAPQVSQHYFIGGKMDLINEKKEDTKQLNDNHGPTSAKLFSLNSQYSGLSSEAQAVILAGKLGRSIVRSTSQPCTPASSSIRRGALVREQSVMFEIKERDESHDHDNHHVDDLNTMNHGYNFISPNARLIRSMRRCDRKFLPLLDQWSTVDVLITRFEIVYLDTAVDEIEDSVAQDGIRQALQATKGGKGLRLCDVVTGRRVAGRVALADISSLHVERLLPHHDGPRTTDDGAPLDFGLNEYWKLSPTTLSPVNSLPHVQDRDHARTQAWNHIKEDHLTIGTMHGHTLTLRFYADLDDAKHHPEHHLDDDELTGSIFKNYSFQWVQTIGRFCGPEQLKKQQLSHFGDDSSNELRDYLTIIDRSVTRKGLSHRRGMSDTGDDTFAMAQSFRGLPTRTFSRPKLISRVSSLDVHLASSQARPMPRPNLLRRMSSLDVHFASNRTSSLNSNPLQAGPLPASPSSNHVVSGESGSASLFPLVRNDDNAAGNETGASKTKKVSFSDTI